MQEKQIEIENPLGKIFDNSNSALAKLDVVLHSNALILSKLNNSSYEVEMNLLNEKVAEKYQILRDEFFKNNPIT